MWARAPAYVYVMDNCDECENDRQYGASSGLLASQAAGHVYI